MPRLFGFNTGRGHRRARIMRFTAPRAERPGRGADDDHSFVSMIHHTARGKARPVMGCMSVRSARADQPEGGR